MPISVDLPIGLTTEFAHDPTRQALWQAFLKKNELAATPLHEVVKTLAAGLHPALRQARLLSGQAGQ